MNTECNVFKNSAIKLEKNFTGARHLPFEDDETGVHAAKGSH